MYRRSASPKSFYAGGAMDLDTLSFNLRKRGRKICSDLGGTRRCLLIRGIAVRWTLREGAKIVGSRANVGEHKTASLVGSDSVSKRWPANKVNFGDGRGSILAVYNLTGHSSFSFFAELDRIGKEGGRVIGGNPKFAKKNEPIRFERNVVEPRLRRRELKESRCCGPSSEALAVRVENNYGGIRDPRSRITVNNYAIHRPR